MICPKLIRIIQSGLFILLVHHAISQNTVGLISHNLTKSYEGLNLFFPHNQSSVFLINNCGELINEWTDSNDFRPGNMVYLTDEGNLLKCKRFFNSNQDPIWAGGGGQVVEMLDWDNNLIWSLELNNEQQRLHHDVALMPNGNVLMIAWEVKNNEEAIAAGRDPASLETGDLWPDFIFEYNPELDSMVWEWHAWDHLVQDFDDSKNNYGDVSENPQLIDINWETNLGFPDWLHSNAIDYNESLDQILLCVPHFDEIWIIDHSTTTEEAASHEGGRSGKGGDLLFRWGNPAAYKKEGAQQLHFAHDAQWVDNFITNDLDHYRSISLFNNRVGEDYSTVDILNPEVDGSYQLSDSGSFLPEQFALTITHPDTFSLYSNSLSGTQVLPNDNLLICSGRFGTIFEIEPTTNNVVWEYKVPFKGGQPVPQGTELKFNDNVTFRFSRYPLDFAGFENKNLEPKGYIELDPNEAYCDTLISSVNATLSLDQLNIYPNPVSSNMIQIELTKPLSTDLFFYDIYGRRHKTISKGDRTYQVNVSELKSGVYFIATKNEVVEKLVINR